MNENAVVAIWDHIESIDFTLQEIKECLLELKAERRKAQTDD